MKGRRFGREGSAASIGLMVGLIVFTSGFYFLATTVQEPPTSTLLVAEERNYQAAADALSNTLLGAGNGWYSGASCTPAGNPNTASLSPEQVGSQPSSRFGLGEEPCGHAGSMTMMNNVSLAKLANIYEAGREADPANDRVDYEEARGSLGLDQQGLDFHLRTWLIPSSLEEIIGSGRKDAYLRPLYIGHYLAGSSAQVPHTAGVVNNADHVILYVRVTNDRTGSTIFGVEFSLPLDRGDIDVRLHTPLLATGQSHNVTLTIRKTSDWRWDDEAFAIYALSDPFSSLQTGTIDMSGVSMTYASQRSTPVVSSDQYYVLKPGATVAVQTRYASYDGTGRSTVFTDWTQRVYGPPLGLPVATSVIPNTDDGQLTATLAATGTFTARLQNDLLTSTWNEDRVNVLSAAPGAYGGGVSAYTPSSAVAAEANFVQAVVEDFQPNAHDADYNHVLLPYQQGGDVMPDIRSVLEADLLARLQDDAGLPSLLETTTLIVGSDVDHHAMRTGPARQVLADWVEAGGTLIVLGSQPQTLQWLSLLFGASFNPMDGATTALDGSHPALRMPNDLDYPAYINGVEIDYNGVDGELFHGIIGNGEGEDLLAMSNNGAFGAGRIVIAGWRPYALTAAQASTCATPFTVASQCEGLRLLHNLLTLSYRELFIDYGPTPSAQSPTGTSLRIVSVYHPQLAATVSMAMQVVVFREGG